MHHVSNSRHSGGDKRPRRFKTQSVYSNRKEIIKKSGWNARSNGQIPPEKKKNSNPVTAFKTNRCLFLARSSGFSEKLKVPQIPYRAASLRGPLPLK